MCKSVGSCAQVPTVRHTPMVFEMSGLVHKPRRFVSRLHHSHFGTQPRAPAHGGIDVAVEALRDFSRKYRGGATELARFARTGDDYQTLRAGKLPDISPRDC